MRLIKLNFLIIKRYFSSSVRANKSFFITTPIFYVNAAPHIGHLYSAVVADTIQRWQHIIEPNQDIVFSTGTDEHGIKIQNAALQNNVLPKIYCENISSQYKALFNQCEIGYTDFIRTSSNIAHYNAVQHFWNELKKSGKIYSANYQGWYCVPDETFLTESQITEKHLSDGSKIKISIESGHPVEWTQEQNYLFRLSAFQQDLYNWLKSNENIVKPKKFQHILMDWLNDKELPDISVSRPTSRVHWGIPVPQSDAGGEASTPSQTIYVWLDALINYLTVAGYPDVNSEKFINSWPPDVHIVGKDILKFHGIYWPAFLMACQLPLPKQILCHSHWTVNGEKMSKSKGNVIAPQDLFETYTAEGLRYFLIREGVPHSDGNYSETKLCRILNSELADTFGNLLSRCCGKALNPQQMFPTIDEETLNELCLKEDVTRRLLDSVEALPDIVRDHYNSYNFYKGIDQIIATLHITNLFFETLRPWELKKSNNLKLLNGCLCITLETLRVCAILLQPIIPQLTNQLLTKINVSNTKRNWNSLKPFMWQHHKKQLMYTNGETNGMQQQRQQQPISLPVSLTNDSALLFKRIQMQNKK